MVFDSHMIESVAFVANPQFLQRDVLRDFSIRVVATAGRAIKGLLVYGETRRLSLRKSLSRRAVCEAARPAANRYGGTDTPACTGDFSI
jgi:hypothetical protein